MLRKELKSQENSRSASELPHVLTRSHHKMNPEKVLQIYSSVLSPDRLISRETSTGVIGPGYYDFNSSSLGGPFCTFSCVKRFTPTYSGVSSPQAKDFSNFAVRNKDLTQYQPQNKKDLLKIKAKNEQIRIEQALKNKQKISKDKKKEKLKRIQEKHNKFKMKIKHVEVKMCSNAWVTLLGFITIATSLRCKKNYLKALRKRSGKLRRFLRVVCRFIGKFRLRVRKNKIKKAISKITGFVFCIKKWIFKKKLKYIAVINEVIYKAAAKEKIFRFMYHWKNCLTFIQRIWKKALIEKKISMALRLLCWEKIEKNMQESQPSIKGKIKPKFISVTPNLIREKMIKTLLKDRIREYCKNLKKYKETIREQFTKQRVENVTTPGGKRNNLNLFIKKPEPNYNFSRRDYVKLIKKAVLFRKNSKTLLRVPSFKYK